MLHEIRLSFVTAKNTFVCLPLGCVAGFSGLRGDDSCMVTTGEEVNVHLLLGRVPQHGSGSAGGIHFVRSSQRSDAHYGRDKAVTLSTRKARRKRKGEAVSECSMILTRRMTKTTARPLLCSKPRRNPARPISYFAMGGGGTTS